MTHTNNYWLIQAKLNITKLQPGLGAFYAIWPGKVRAYALGPGVHTGAYLLKKLKNFNF